MAGSHISKPWTIEKPVIFHAIGFWRGKSSINGGFEWTMDHWNVIFLARNFHSVQGFSSTPCLMNQRVSQLAKQGSNRPALICLAQGRSEVKSWFVPACGYRLHILGWVAATVTKHVLRSKFCSGLKVPTFQTWEDSASSFALSMFHWKPCSFLKLDIPFN